MNHNFIKHPTPKRLTSEFMTRNNESSYEKCSKCSLELFSFSPHSDIKQAQFMYFNGKEVFHNYFRLEDVDYSCEDLIIKNIIE